jgi:hypothetical protein
MQPPDVKPTIGWIVGISDEPCYVVYIDLEGKVSLKWWPGWDPYPDQLSVATAMLNETARIANRQIRAEFENAVQVALQNTSKSTIGSIKKLFNLPHDPEVAGLDVLISVGGSNDAPGFIIYKGSDGKLHLKKVPGWDPWVQKVIKAVTTTLVEVAKIEDQKVRANFEHSTQTALQHISKEIVSKVAAVRGTPDPIPV